MAKTLDMLNSEDDRDYVLVWSHGTGEGASQIEITRWLEFGDIALQRDRERKEAG